MNIEKYHHGHLREALINGACQQIEQEGATALNLSKLAKKIGVSQPAVYRHFPNKQALAISVAQRGLERLTEALQKTTQHDENDSFNSIRAITKAYVEFTLNNREIARLMFSMKERTTEPVLYDVSVLAAAPIFRIVEAAHSSDRLRNKNVVQVVRIIWAAIHGLAMLLVDEQMPFVTQSPDELLEYIEATAKTLYIGLFVI